MMSALSQIYHILDEIQFLESKVNSTKNAKANFLKNETLKRAFCRSLEVIGGSVRKLPLGIYKEYPNISWKRYADIHNRLVNCYGCVDYDLVWDVAENHLKQLKQYLEHIVAMETQKDEEEQGIG